jgi:hypothetical protein
VSNIPTTWRELQREALTRCQRCDKPLTHVASRRGHTMHAPCRRAENAERATANLAAEPNEYMRRNAYLFRGPDPLNAAFRQWQGGAPRSDWRASLGVVRDTDVWMAVAA